MKIKITKNLFIQGGIFLAVIIIVIIFYYLYMKQKSPSPTPSSPTPGLTQIKDGTSSGKCVNGMPGATYSLTGDDCRSKCISDDMCKGYQQKQNDDPMTDFKSPCTFYASSPTKAKKAKGYTCMAKN